jgi:chorismate dehydratase
MYYFRCSKKQGMDKIRISAVRYANTYPFIYGLTERGFDKKSVLETDHPSECAAKVIAGRSDLGLIPVAAIPLIINPHIITDYCIGTNGKVRTVQMMSNSTFEGVKKIYLDYRSRTSVNLIKVLAKEYWKKDFKWIDTSETFDFKSIRSDEAVVLIGDQCFEFEYFYQYKYDLGEEWKKFSGLPFVFACWVSNKPLPAGFIDDFNNALSLGVENIDLVTDRYGRSGSITGTELRKYLTENIDFHLNTEKKKAMSLFLDLLKKL